MAGAQDLEHLLGLDLARAGLQLVELLDQFGRRARGPAHAVERGSLVGLEAGKLAQVAAELTGYGVHLDRRGQDIADETRERRQRSLAEAHIVAVAAALDAGELGGAAADVDERAALERGGAAGADEPEVRLVARGQQRDRQPAAPLDFRDGLGAVRGVAQHGGGEHVDALTAEVAHALHVAFQHVDGAVHAVGREHAILHERGKARHHLVVDDAFEVLAGIGAATIVLHFVDDKANGVRPQVDDAVGGHCRFPSSMVLRADCALRRCRRDASA